MKTIEISLYDYKELSDEAKVKALEKHNADGEMYFLEDNLSEYLSELLKENNINSDDEKLFYSLSYCQGDGVCFVGNFEYKGITFNVTHNHRYYHSNSPTIEAEHADDGDELKNDLIDVLEAEFIEVYKEICDKIEKSGYEQIEYEHSEENFIDLCDANEYTFEADGNMRNF